jgi:small subunit ribosomal protein S1
VLAQPSTYQEIILMSESFAELFEQSLEAEKFIPGTLVIGTVVAKDRETLTVNVGLKSEGIIPADQFKNTEGVVEVEVGDEVEVALEAIEDGFGETKLSREKAKRMKAWVVLEAAQVAGDIVQGVINGKVKGGFTVDVEGIRAFLPGSLVDVRPLRDISHLEGKEIDLKVIKLDQRRNNVVVSRRAVVENEYSAEREELLNNLAEGLKVKGVVKNLTDYGAFVDLGGIDGLLHITDMSWKRIKHPSEMIAIGDELDLVVLRFEKERNRVSLGLKQNGDDPWIEIQRRYPEGHRLFGKVTNITDYGAFVELEEGVEGLVHVSEMDWTNKNVNPNKLLTLGEEVEVAILQIDEEKRRISLGMKQCKENPWNEFAGRYNKGDRITGTIKSITDFGIFIGLDGDIDGLVHLSDISWNITGEEAVREYKKGQEIEALVLAVDAERERISLGVKQLDQDPFSTYLAEHPRGSIVTGSITEVDAKGAKVHLADEVEGYIRVSEISDARIEDASTELKVGDEVEAKFVNIDKKSRMISLSIRAKDKAESDEVMAQYQNSTSSGSSFGELLQAKLKGNDES